MDFIKMLQEDHDLSVFMELKIIPAYDFPKEIGILFSEYTEMLIAGDPSFQEYLAIQNYDEELEHLDIKYGLPGGRLYIAFYDGKLAGCIGLRKIDERNCEMKRLYVRPAFRGKYRQPTGLANSQRCKRNRIFPYVIRYASVFEECCSSV